MAFSIKSLVTSVLGGGGDKSGKPTASTLFQKTDPAVDGDDCLHDCSACTVRYPRGFKIDDEDHLYGEVKAWSTHVLVGTNKTDWVRDVTDEKGSVMEAIGRASAPSNGNMKLSASNMPTPDNCTDYSEPTTLLLLPAFTLVHNAHPANVPQFIADIVNAAPTSTTPLSPAPPALPASLPPPAGAPAGLPGLTTADCPHSAVVLMCSHRTRDARCGQSAPLLRKEMERHLRPLGLYRDLHDERPGGVGIYFINHVGGHKYSANVIVYRRPNAFGLDAEAPSTEANGEEAKTNGVNGEKHSNGDTNGTTNGDARSNGVANGTTNGTTNGETHANGVANGDGQADEDDDKDKLETGRPGAAQCIWLARVMPEDCENLIRYTVLRGKVVKPERQLRGGFDRGRGVMSW